MAELISMAKKRNPPKAKLEWKEFHTFIDSFSKESDRGGVLISAALLDDLLERSIRCLLLDHSLVDELFDRGTLGSLDSKVQMAFALGILSESEYQECDRVRRVRNVFAHEVSCDFETKKVKEICSKFTFGSKPGVVDNSTPRGKYFASAIGLLATLWSRPEDVSKRRPKYVEPR